MMLTSDFLHNCVSFLISLYLFHGFVLYPTLLITSPNAVPLPLAFIAFQIRTLKADLGGGAGCHTSEPRICDFDL